VFSAFLYINGVDFLKKGKMPGKNSPLISVVIPAWNEEKYIGRTVKSLLNQSLDREEYEIIIVDGRSTDRTAQIARRLGAKVFYENEKSIGGARNVGAKKAKGKYVAFVDADCIAPRGWLLRIKKTFERKGEKLKGIGGFGVPINPRWQDKLAFFILDYYWKVTSWLGIYHFVGFNCVYSRKEFLKLGGFNPKIKFMEDVEMSFRFRRAGHPCKVSRRLKMMTSPRRFSQMGLLKLLGMVVVGYYCLFFNKPFPWEYGRLLKKHGAIDR